MFAEMTSVAQPSDHLSRSFGSPIATRQTPSIRIKHRLQAWQRQHASCEARASVLRLQRSSCLARTTAIPQWSLSIKSKSPTLRIAKRAQSACQPTLLAETRLDAETIQQVRVAYSLRVLCGQQHVADENRVRAGDEAQRLQLVGHVLTAGG